MTSTSSTWRICGGIGSSITAAPVVGGGVGSSWNRRDESLEDQDADCLLTNRTASPQVSHRKTIRAQLRTGREAESEAGTVESFGGFDVPVPLLLSPGAAADFSLCDCWSISPID